MFIPHQSVLFNMNQKDNRGWFTHDMDAAADPKLLTIVAHYGMAGYGMWWRLIEFLRSQPGYMFNIDSKVGYPSLMQLFSCKLLEASKFIKDCIELELLILNNGNISSNSLTKRMEKMEIWRTSYSERGKKGAEITNKIKKLKKVGTADGTAETQPNSQVGKADNGASAQPEAPKNDLKPNTGADLNGVEHEVIHKNEVGTADGTAEAMPSANGRLHVGIIQYNTIQGTNNTDGDGLTRTREEEKNPPPPKVNSDIPIGFLKPEECLDLYFSSVQFLKPRELLALRSYISIEELKKWAEQFNEHIYIEGKFDKNISDWSSHFNRWLKFKVSKPKVNNTPIATKEHLSKYDRVKK
jgi:hypothetical protein